jgi:hypothetical protein
MLREKVGAGVTAQALIYTFNRDFAQTKGSAWID